jgi:hypothetical protein
VQLFSFWGLTGIKAHYLLRPDMRERINKAISHLDLQIAGGRGDGCFYFVHKTKGALNADSVMVSAMTHLPLSTWVEEAESAYQQHSKKKSFDLIPVIKLSKNNY